MVYRTSIPVWPTTLNAITWSKDNLIAVAAGESVGIFSPLLHEPGPNGEPWRDILFKSNAFTLDEIPRSNPLTFQNFSPGEELSLRHVQALEWSSPGLARYNRCVLAVLSSNHVLSIWEHDGRPDDGTKWKRKIVVNHAIQKHYDCTEKKVNESQEDRHERRQVQQRVRAFVWSPPMYEIPNKEEQTFTQYVDRGYQSLAVATEAEEILLLRVLSPHNVVRPDIVEWKIDVVHSLDLRAYTLEALHLEIPGNERNSLSDNDEKFIADHIAWGPWRRGNNGTGNRARLAFISNGRLFCVEVEANVCATSLEARLVHGSTAKTFVRSRSDMTGPLKFIPKTTFLTAFSADEVYCVDTSLDPADISTTSHHLDGRWDETSGLAATYGGNGHPQIHISSHLSSSIASTTSLSLPLHKDEISIPPLWQTAMNESKATYSAQHNLDDHVRERTWGIAASPMGEYIATATSMLPSDSVAYVITAEQRTIINITNEIEREECGALPPSGGVNLQTDVTAESLLFSLQRYLERQSQPADAELLVQAMLVTTNAPQEHSHFDEKNPPSFDGYETAQIVRHLRMQIFMHPELLKERFKLLVDVALRRASNANQISKIVVQRLVSEVLRLPSRLEKGSELSEKLPKLYETIQLKMQAQPPSDTTEASGEPWSEECSICHKALPFESVKWAKCESGHQFSRCGLTFFAIQEPGISKHCAICRSQFLNEWSLPGFRASAEDVHVEMEDLPAEDDASQAIAFSNNVEDPTAHVQPQVGVAQEQSSPEDVNRGGDNIHEQRPSPEASWVKIIRSSTAAIEPPTSLARILFAAFDTCVYCGGKFVA